MSHLHISVPFQTSLQFNYVDIYGQTQAILFVSRPALEMLVFNTKTQDTERQ